MQRTFTVTEIIEIIQTNEKAACSALLGLYARQTADEQAQQATGHQNGMGFNGTDAFILSSLAEQVKRNREAQASGNRPKNWSDLSPKQMEIVRKKLPKYSRQLLQIVEEKQAARAAA